MNISKQDIESRAYAIWERQGRPQGKDKEHWYLAERQLVTEQTAPPKASRKTSGAARKRPATASKQARTANGKAKAA